MKAKGGVVLADGPAAGRYSVRRAPHFLRAVRFENVQDVLDQLNDEPRLGEKVYVYELDASEPHFDPDVWARTHNAFICPTPGASGTYRHRPDVDAEALRETSSWRAWCRAQQVAVPLVDGVTLEPVGEARPA
jgi:hypothetical protein